jgi:hypothetical protein
MGAMSTLLRNENGGFAPFAFYLRNSPRNERELKFTVT